MSVFLCSRVQLLRESSSTLHQWSGVPIIRLVVVVSQEIDMQMGKDISGNKEYMPIHLSYS